MKTVQEFLAQKEVELASAARELEALRVVAPLLRDEEDRVGMTRPKILLVGGNDDTRNAMRESLENENCDVVTSGTIAEGLSQILAQQHFDVLITDLRPRRTGDNPTLVAAMRTFQPACLLVAVSDSLTIQEAAMAISLEADVIVKPSNIKQVAELLYARTVTLKSPPSSDIDQWVAKDSRRIA